MSNQPEQNSAPQLPDAATAYNTVLNTVHADAFFAKLAEYGYRPTSVEDAQDMLAIGLRLDQASQAEKQASQSPYAVARQALEQELAHRGVIHQDEANVSEINRVKAAAWQYAQDPQIFTSALVLASLRAQG